MPSSSLIFLYAVSAAAFLLLAALVTLGWRRDVRGGLFTAACWGTCLWSFAIVGIGLEWSTALILLPVAEWLRVALWLFFIGSLFVESPKHLLLQWWKRPAARAIGLLLLLGLISAVYGTTSTALFPEGVRLSQHWLILMLLLMVVGMVTLETLYRRAGMEARWKLKFLCIGIGGLFAFDFILYADILLFRGLNPVLWTARALVNTLLVPFLAVAAARNRAWKIDIQVSRQVVFQSSIGLLSGLYLLGLALGGYYIRYQGGAWGEVAQIVVLFLGTVFFVTLLASRQFRSRVRVFVSKNFFSYQFDYREQWLKFTQLLSADGMAQSVETSALQAISGLVESPRGQLWLRVGSGPHATYELAVENNMNAPGHRLPANAALIQALQERGWVIDLEHPNELGFNLMIPDWLQRQTGARLIVPLSWQNDLLGFVVLGQPQGGLRANWEVNDLLKVAGRQAASYLAQARAARDLLVARQFESFNKMSAFIVHDLKNLVSQLDLILTNAPRLIDRPDFQKDMLDTVANSVQRMKGLLTQLQDQRMPSEHAVVLDLQQLCQHAVDSFKNAPITPRLRLVETTRIEVIANPERLERVVRHLLANAQDAVLARDHGGHREGSIELRVALRSPAVAGEQVELVLSDSGIGMSAEFIRNRLFQPFESTKKTGTGLGLYESREYIHSLGGEITVQSTPGVGTTITIHLPRYQPADLQ